MHYRTMTTSAILAAALATAPLAGGMVAQAQEKKSTTQEVKTAVSDSWVTAKTKISLFADERVKGTQVSVETKDGVVHLHGKVDSAEAKSAAGEITKGIDGAKSVRNDLQVVAPPARKAVDTTDAQITKQVESTLARDAQLKKVDVRTDAGLVTLKGEVPTIVASAKASETARSVPGVRSVRNELTFQQ
jgi:osmotically-inducible protein OsmY